MTDELREAAEEMHRLMAWPDDSRHEPGTDPDCRFCRALAAIPETPTGFHCSGCDGHDIDLGNAPLFSHIRNLGGAER